MADLYRPLPRPLRSAIGGTACFCPCRKLIRSGERFRVCWAGRRRGRPAPPSSGSIGRSARTQRPVPQACGRPAPAPPSAAETPADTAVVTLALVNSSRDTSSQAISWCVPAVVEAGCWILVLLDHEGAAWG